MKKLPRFTLLIFGALLLAGCTGIVNQPAQSGKQGEARAKFETYSKLAAAENGAHILEVHNQLPKDVILQITIPEDESAWKLFEIPAQRVLEIELGTMDYLLQVQDDSSSQILLPQYHTVVNIAPAESNFYQIFIPSEE